MHGIYFANKMHRACKFSPCHAKLKFCLSWPNSRGILVAIKDKTFDNGDIQTQGSRARTVDISKQ